MFLFVDPPGHSQSGTTTGHWSARGTTASSTVPLTRRRKACPKSNSRLFLLPPKPNLSLLLRLPPRKKLCLNWWWPSAKWRWTCSGCLGENPGWAWSPQSTCTWRRRRPKSKSRDSQPSSSQTRQFADRQTAQWLQGCLLLTNGATPGDR